MSAGGDLLRRTAQYILENEYAELYTTHHAVTIADRHKFSDAYSVAMDAFEMLKPQEDDVAESEVFWWGNNEQGDEHRVLGLCFAAAMADDVVDVSTN